MMVVPSLVSLCILAAGPYADGLDGVEWTPIPFREEIVGDIEEMDVDGWTVLVRLFCGIPDSLCCMRTKRMPKYRHGFLTVLSLAGASVLTAELLCSTPNLTALDGSSTSLCSLPRSLVHLRIVYLRKCRQITNEILSSLLSLPLLSVIDLTGTQCSPGPDFPFFPSQLTLLFQPSIQASLSAFASIYKHTLPSPLYILTYLPPLPPKPTLRPATQDSFVVFSSSSTKLGNTNTLLYQEERPRLLSRPITINRPRQSSTPLHFHRPPLHHNQSPSVTNPRPSLSSTTQASLNLQSHKAQQALNGIQSFIKLRSTLPVLPSVSKFTTLSSTTKNPFKKPTLNPISSFPPPPIPNHQSTLPRKKPKLTQTPAKQTPSTSFDWKTWSSSPSI